MTIFRRGEFLQSKMKLKQFNLRLLHLAVWMGAVTFFFSSPSSALAGEPLKVTWRTKAPLSRLEKLKDWGQEALGGLKGQNFIAHDPERGGPQNWSGYSLEDVVQTSLERLSLYQRSTVDLVVLKGADGTVKALIPRAFLRRQWVLLVREGEGAEQTWRTVAPWKPTALRKHEVVPSRKYFVNELREVELTSYQAHFAGVRLQQRRDPFLLRGERIFVQNCMGCHYGNDWPDAVPAQAEHLLSLGLPKALHEKISEMPTLHEADWRGVEKYIDRIRSGSVEHAKKTAAAGT